MSYLLLSSAVLESANVQIKLNYNITMASIYWSKSHLIDIPSKWKHKHIAICDNLHMVPLDYITNYDSLIVLNIIGLFKKGNELGYSNEVLAC